MQTPLKLVTTQAPRILNLPKVLAISPAKVLQILAMADMVQPWGEPDAEAASVFFNAGYQLDDDTEAYAFGNYRESESDGSFFYRYPRNGTIEQLRERDGGIYDPLEKYPGGFTPRFFGEIKDMSIVGGIRGELDNGLTYDFSGRRGESEIKYTLVKHYKPFYGPCFKKIFPTWRSG